MLGIIDHIASLLDQEHIRFERDKDILEMRWKTDHFDDLKIKIIASRDGSWASIVAPFNNFYEVEDTKRMELAYKMLKESWSVNGVKFAINENDDLIVVAETNDTDLTAD
ncbi:MAG: hypothetical protein ACTSU3_04240, partial [Candidatus Thorarchaeota archaeon]